MWARRFAAQVEWRSTYGLGQSVSDPGPGPSATYKC